MSAESGGEPGPCVVAQVAQKLEDHVLDLGSSCRPGPFSPLHIAAVRDDAVLAKKILADCEPAAIPPLLREDESCTGSCALTVAAEYGSLAFLREVVQHVGDLASVLLPVYQSNMLGGAARNGHADVVDLLLSSFKRNRQNGDLDFKHNDQIAVSPFKHALSAALLSGHGHIAQKILRHAAPWPEADEASLLAAKNCDIQTLEGLAEAVTDFGKTRGANVALVLAAISGCDEAAKVLLGAGVNPNNGHSVAFHFPALADPHGLCHVCDFLPGGRHRSDRPGVCDFLPSGIIEAFQKRGMVAYAGALAAGHGKIMKMLDDNGAAPHAAYSVLFAAIAVKNSSVARQCLRTFGMLLAPQAMGQIYAEGLLFSLLAGNSEMVRFFMTLEFEMDGKSGPLLSSCQRLKELFEWIEPETSTNDDRPITVRQTVLGEYSVFLPEMTPLMFAIGIGNADLAATLIEGGANVSIAIPGVGDALCMLCDLHMKNPQIAFDRRKDPATPRERTFTGQPWWKEWIFDDDTGLWIDNPDFNRNWRDNDEDCRDRAESAAQNAAHLWGHFLEVRRSFSEAEVQRSFQRLCGLLLKNGVDAHKKHIGLSSSIFGSVCSRMADEICGVRGRNGVSGIGACYIFRTFLESGVLISVANLDFVIPAFFSLTEFSEFLLAVKNRPDAVSILLRIWIGEYGDLERLGEREVKSIVDLLGVLWQHPELKDFDINSKVQGEAGAVGDTPRRVPGEGGAAAVRGGIIAAFLENYAGLLAMLQRGAKFPPRDVEGLQLGDVAADAQNVHTTYHQRHLAGHVEEARATIGRPLTPLDQEHFFMHLEELSDENIERIRADVANARGRRLPEIRVALVVSARRVFGIVAGEAGAMIGGGDAMALVFRRLEHDARAHGEDMESYVVGPIAQALLGAYCEYDWERPACAAGAIAMIIGVLQGRTLGAEIPDDVQKLPADINSYLRLLRVVRNKDNDTIQQEATARLLTGDRVKLQQIFDKFIDGEKVIFAQNELRGLLFGAVLAEFDHLVAKLFLEDDEPRVTPAVETLLRNMAEIAEVFTECLADGGSFSVFLDVMRDLGIAGEGWGDGAGEEGEDSGEVIGIAGEKGSVEGDEAGKGRGTGAAEDQRERAESVNGGGAVGGA